MVRCLVVALALLSAACAPTPKLGPGKQAEYAALLLGARAACDDAEQAIDAYVTAIRGLELEYAKLAGMSATPGFESLAPQESAWKGRHFFGWLDSPSAKATGGPDGYVDDIAAADAAIGRVGDFVHRENPFGQEYLGPKWEALRDATDALKPMMDEALDPLAAEARPITSTADAEARIWQHAEATGRARAEFDAAMARFRAGE